MFQEYKKKRKRSLFLRICDGLMGLLTVAVLLSWMGFWLGKVVSPAVWWVPALVILAGPLIYLAVVVVAGYWILRWRVVWMVLLAVPTFYVLLSMGAFIQIPIWSHKGDELRQSLCVVSYNVHGFHDLADGDSIRMAQVAQWLTESKADVVLLQEYCPLRVDTMHVAAQMFDRWTYVVAQTGARQYENAFGVVVLSRYKILNTRFLSYEKATGGALVVDIDVAGDTVRFYNCHLQTTAFNQVNHRESLGALLDAPDRKVRTRSTVRALRDGFLLREVQADSIAANIAKSPYPVIVGGDLNSVPLSDTYYTMRGDRVDAFRQAGEGYGATYRPMAGMLRIDYLFPDAKMWEVTEYQSPNLRYSDHKPVRVVLRKNKK